MHTSLWRQRILLEHLEGHVTDVTSRLRRVERAAADAGRPLISLDHQRREEGLARDVARRDGVRSGLVCVFGAVQCCRSFSAHPDRQSKQLVLRFGPKKCLHYYHDYPHPQLGLMHARSQSWFPFTAQVCLDGREWLARMMDQAGIGHVKKGNCFVDVEDLDAAQALLDPRPETDWPAPLSGIAASSNPAEASVFGDFPVRCYWSVDESEWATDFLFRSPQALAAPYPSLLRHGTLVLGSADVPR